MEDIIQVGKYTLESLTTGMYSDPKIIYREYIQNSVDALEMALQINLLEPQSMRIDSTTEGIINKYSGSFRAETIFADQG